MTFSTRLILLGAIWAAVIVAHLDFEVPTPGSTRAERVVAGALDRIAAQPGAEWQLKSWQEATWAALKEQGISWKAPDWFIEEMETANDKREAMKNASIRLHTKP
jgi:hypothetical protein